MTTSVTVCTAAHPARVITFPCKDGQPVSDGKWSDPVRVEPNSEAVFYVHSGQDVCVQELALDAG